MTPQDLLIELRTLNIRVRVDGDLVRCKAPEGETIPGELADQIRTLKPGLLDRLREEAAAIAWRVESGLLAETVALQPIGACTYCGAKMPGRQIGKCVLCCLAAAELLSQRWERGQTTYPLTASGGDSGTQSISLFERECDMSSDRTEAA